MKLLSRLLTFILLFVLPAIVWGQQTQLQIWATQYSSTPSVQTAYKDGYNKVYSNAASNLNTWLNAYSGANQKNGFKYGVNKGISELKLNVVYPIPPSNNTCLQTWADAFGNGNYVRRDYYIVGFKKVISNAATNKVSWSSIYTTSSTRRLAFKTGVDKGLEELNKHTSTSCGAPITPTPTSTPTLTPTLSPTPTVVQTPTPTASPTATPTTTPSSTPTATPTPTPSATPTPTPSPSPTPTPSSTPTPSPSPTATPSSTPTATPTATPTPGINPIFAGVWANDGGDKVTQDERRKMQGENVLNSVWDGTTVNVFGAKNEVTQFSLYMECGPIDCPNITVELSTLTGPGGATIFSNTATGNQVFDYVGRNIEGFYVRYLPIQGLSALSYPVPAYDERQIPTKLQRPWTGNGVAVGGTTWLSRPNHDKFYPEIAVPLETQGQFTVLAGKSQQIWYDIYIPTGKAAGTYTGNISVRSNGTLRHLIPVSLEVKNFTLPDMMNATNTNVTYVGTTDIMRRTFGVPYPVTAPQEAGLYTQFKNAARLLHRHRIQVINDDVNFGVSAAPQGRPRTEWNQYLNGTAFSAANLYDGPGVDTPNNVYSIGTYGAWTTQWANTQAAFRTASDAWYTYMNANFPSVLPFIYLIDESLNFTQTNTWAGWVKDNPGVGQNLRTFATNDWYSCTASIPKLTICTGIINWRLPSAIQAAYTALTTTGRLAWRYNAQRPLSGSFATEDEGVSPRELPIGNNKRGVQGYFFWQANYWRDQQVSGTDNDLFHNAKTFGAFTSTDAIYGRRGSLYSNGDGVLLYPGTDTVFPSDSYGLSGPLASLRLKNWRRGIQDSLYVDMARVACASETNTALAILIPKALDEYPVDDTNDPTYGHAPVSWSTNPDVWEAFRLNLANKIILGGCSSGPTPTATGTATPTATGTPTPTPSASPVPTATPTATGTPTATPSATPTPSPTPSSFVAATYGTVRQWLQFSDETKVLNASGTQALNGEAVDQVNDSSGNSRTGKQTSNTARPTVVTGLVNGLQGIRFDGVNDFLRLPQSRTYTSFVQGMTFVMVYQIRSTATDGAYFTFLDGGSSARARGQYYGAPSNPGQWLQAGRRTDTDPGDNRYSGNGTVQSINTWYIGVFIFDYQNALSKVYANGTAVIPSGTFSTAGATSNTSSTEDPTIGMNGPYGSLPGTIDVTEFVAYNGAMDDTNRDALEVALGARYGITVN